MGLGLQGRGIGDAKLFCEAGSHVTVTDLKSESQLQLALEQLNGLSIRFVLGKHEEEDFWTHDMVLQNPDVPSNSPFLEVAKKAGIPVKMDSSLFAVYYPLPIIGITGTRGKTTTTMMIYEVLKKLYKGSVYLGGNIPDKATLELLKEIKEPQKYASFGSWSTSTHPKSATLGFGRTGDFFRRKKSGPSEKGIVVLELSSWELQGWRDEKISPNISVFTNFYQDHLNRYASMDEYFQDKLAILRYQKKTDWAILNADNPWTKKAATEINSRIKWFSSKDLPQEALLHVPGEHNRANAAAALAVVSVIGVGGKEGLEILKRFRGVPFRLETIATIDGVEYINDTTSTTPAAGIAALRAMTKPVVLITGGSSKKLDLKPLAEEIVESYRKHRVKRVVLLRGEGTDELIVYLKACEVSSCRAGSRSAGQTSYGKLINGVYGDFKVAVTRARDLAISGDAVLLSPGCASFSMFKNEFDRGEQFNQIIRKWQKK